MLILTRKPGETIHIGNDIIITEPEGDSIGIDAPKHIPVHRSEVYQRIKQEKTVRQIVNEVNGNQ